MKGKLISSALVIAVIAICAGCGGVAQDNPDSQIASLQDGRTNYSQVIANMGKPYQDYGSPDGGRTVVYKLNQQQADSDTHIPMLGPYMGAISQVQNKMTLTFDSNGVLTSHSSQVTPAS
ncbi:MAG TPA: hypothetical protein VND20_00695, partial [Candidatus Binataceae bacterium]|nr:hypothetical protein [Candidatus Binataceae bacterium]